ncbi:MAG: Fic family protein [Steroidobacteraceae bacterium]
MKGWYVSSRPDDAPGESTDWYASFWHFCADYLEERFRTEWSLSPEQSIALHIGEWTVPRQLLVRTPKGDNKPSKLPHETAVFVARLELPAEADRQILDRMRTLSLPAALIACSAAQFNARPLEMRTALAMIADASQVLPRLLEGGHSKVAGRLAGAFRNIGRDGVADRILAAMRAAGYTVTESDPFEGAVELKFSPREISPYTNRIRLLWQQMRGPVLEVFPAPPGLPRDKSAYLKAVEDAYVSDAYHSLSIEGYRVNAELIERVRSGSWDPANNENDRKNRDALAARGYWQAFQSVKKSVATILDRVNPGEVVATTHQLWYSELFGPSVSAGIIKASELAGYRNGPVFIRRSMHVPPRAEAAIELLSAFFELLSEETEPAVRVVLGHWVFVYIHPYFDGNGRMGRFLMNAMLSAGGYPWTIIPVESRAEYMAALESASVDRNILPFAHFLSGLMKRET